MSGVIITNDTATRLVARVQQAARIEGLRVVVGRAERNLFREHLFDLNSKRHRYGRNYYAQAARSVTYDVTNAIVISVTQVGFRQRLEGGPIKPKRPRRFITIPAAPEAYGKRAREFNDLDMEKVIDPQTGRLRWALVRRTSQEIRFRRRKQKDGTIKLTIAPGELRERKVMFWLSSGVVQKPDRSVLPTDEKIIRTALGAIDTRLRRLDARGSN